MATTYTVISTQAYVYQDATRRVVEGYRVFFTYNPTGETYSVMVPNLVAGTIKSAIDAMVKQLDDLSKI